MPGAIPVHAGHEVTLLRYPESDRLKAWMPVFTGMTGNGSGHGEYLAECDQPPVTPAEAGVQKRQDTESVKAGVLGTAIYQ